MPERNGDAAAREAASDTAWVASRSSLYLVGRIVPALVIMAALAVYTRFLTPVEFGIVILAIALGELAVMVGAIWLCSTVVRFLVVAEDTAAFFSRVLAIFGVILVGCGAVAAIAGLVWPRHGMIAAYVVAYFAALGWLELHLHALSARLEVATYTVMTMVRSLTAAAIGIALVVGGAGIAGPLTGALAGLVLPGLILAVRHRGLMTWTLPTRASVERLLAYGLPLAASNTLGGLVRQTDRLMLAGLAGPASVGLFGAGMEIADKVIRLVTTAVGNAALPIALRRVEEGQDALKRQMAANLEVLLSLGLPTCVGLILVAEPLCNLLLGEDFRAVAQGVLPLIAIAATLAAVRANYVDHAFQIVQRTKPLTAVMASIVGVNLALNAALIPRFGAEGAAMATAAAHGFGLILAGIVARRSFDLPLPLRTIAPILLATAAMALVVGFLHDRLDQASDAMTLLVLCLVGMASFGIAAVIGNIACIRTLLWTRVGPTRIQRQ